MRFKDFDLELLRVFVTVVDGGGFTRAAERLHRTQSTVSQQIKRLEQRPDTPLLVRSTRSLDLTERGELLLGYARRLLARRQPGFLGVAVSRALNDERTVRSLLDACRDLAAEMSCRRTPEPGSGD